MRLGLVIAFAALPLAAHHSTRAEFDDSKLIAMQGTVTEVLWMNPHGRFSLEVTGTGGDTITLDVEAPSPNRLGNEGWKRNDLKAGDRITLDVYLARDGSHHALVRSIALPDGRIISPKLVEFRRN